MVEVDRGRPASKEGVGWRAEEWVRVVVVEEKEADGDEARSKGGRAYEQRQRDPEGHL